MGFDFYAPNNSMVQMLDDNHALPIFLRILAFLVVGSQRNPGISSKNVEVPQAHSGAAHTNLAVISGVEDVVSLISVATSQHP